MTNTITSQHKQPKRGLSIAHININSLRNKINEVTELLFEHKLHILAISETHLDSSFEDTELEISGYNIYRNDRNRYGGGVAFYVQNHVPVKIRMDMMQYNIEILWLHAYLPHRKPILLGCCYRPPSANNEYLDTICDMLDNNAVVGQDIYFMGDFNIDWFALNCPLKNKMQTATNACGLTQVINKPTRICVKQDGTKTSTCIDHIFTNSPELCKKIFSVPIGSSDHNLIIVVRNIKVSNPGPKMILKRSYKLFNQEVFVNDVKLICWSEVLAANNPEIALLKFNNLFLPLVEKLAPLKKSTVRNAMTPWLDKEIKDAMRIRDQMKKNCNYNRKYM